MTKEPTLSDCRRILGQILVSQYTKPNERRIVELILGNVETQDKDFIRKLKQRVENSIYPDNFDINDLFEIIDELAGKSLVENK
jgi:hypothetical protein